MVLQVSRRQYQGSPLCNGFAYVHTHTPTHTKWLAHHVAINTATSILIFNCVDGLHLCCSVMQTLLYILSGLIVIRVENLIKLNNKRRSQHFFSPERTLSSPSLHFNSFHAAALLLSRCLGSVGWFHYRTSEPTFFI